MFGFLRKGDRKTKGLTPEPYPQSTERYEGHLDEVHRQNDLDSLPIGNISNVPYSSKPANIADEHGTDIQERKFRLIARVRHEGDEDEVEKEAVQPEAYGFPSTSFDGPLEETNRACDLDNVPIRDHVSIYYTGEKDDQKKKTALHLKTSEHNYKTASTPESEQNPEVRLIARVTPHEEPDKETTAKVSSPSGSSTKMFGFLRKGDRKTKGLTPEPYPQSTERYEGHLDEVHRQNDLDSLPICNISNVPYSSKPANIADEHGTDIQERKFRLIARVRHEGDEDEVEKEAVQPEAYGFPSTSFDGPLEETNRASDLDHVPIRDHVSIYYTGEKDDQKKKTAVLHLKTSEHNYKTASTPESEQNPEVRLIARVTPHEEPDKETTAKVSLPSGSSTKMFGFLRKGDRKTKGLTPEPYPQSTERYEGHLDEVHRQNDLDSLPIGNISNVPYSSKPTNIADEHGTDIQERKFRLIARVRHEGDEDEVEKEAVQPEAYGFPSTSFDGPLEETNRASDLDNVPIRDHASIYYTGDKDDQKKKTAVLHLKTSEHKYKPASTPESEQNPEVRLIARVTPHEEPDKETSAKLSSPSGSSTKMFGFLRKGDRKTKGLTPEPYPQSTERYEGYIDEVHRQNDLDSLPIGNISNVAYSSKPTNIADEHDIDIKERKFRLITRVRHEGDEDEVEKEAVQPEAYGFPSTSFDGPLEETNRASDLDNVPIRDHVYIYYTGEKEDQKKKRTSLPLKTSPSKNKTVSTPESEQNPEVRLIARVTPHEEPNKETSAKVSSPSGSSTKMFGFLRKRGYGAEKSVSSSPAATTAKEIDRTNECILMDSQNKNLVENCSVNYPFTEQDVNVTAQYRNLRREGCTEDGQNWVEVRVERRLEIQLEPVFCLSGAGLGAVSEDPEGLIFSTTPPPQPMPSGRSLLNRLGFSTGKGKKSSKKTKKESEKAENEANSSDSSSESEDEQTKRLRLVAVQPLKETGEEREWSSASNLDAPATASRHDRRRIQRLETERPRPVGSQQVTRDVNKWNEELLKEGGQPETLVSSWQENQQLPDEVVVEYDEHGNKITRTIKTSQVKHTVQKHTYQNFIVTDDNGVEKVERSREQITPIGGGVSSEGKGGASSGPMVETETRTVSYESNEPNLLQTNSELGEFVSSKTVTTGNRTVETITYKTEKDGVIETHVEHRVTIHSEAPIDHDSELSAAIMEATQMNPDMTVEKIEVRQESTG